MTLQNRNLLAKALAAVAIAGMMGAWAVGQAQDAEVARRDKDVLARITEKMTTVCLGRFLVDMPDEARLELAQPGIDGFDISSFDEPEADFKVRLGYREARLQAAPDQFGGNKNLESVIEVKTDNGVNGKIFVHNRTVVEGTRSRGLELERYRDEGVAVEALLHGQGMSFDLSANDYDPDRIGDLVKLVAKLVPNPDNQTPTEPGFCVHRAWFRDPLTAEQGEQIMMFARLPSHPDVKFIAILAAGNKPSQRGLLERTTEAEAGLTPAEKKRLSNLRATSRTIGGLPGDEVITRVAEMNDAIVYTFWWEVDGTEDDVRVPHFVFKMYVGKGENGPVPSSLSQEAAVALWDKISSSIRLRPIAPPRQAAAYPPQTRLGSYVWAGVRCPESGWWLCDDPRVLDGTHWFAGGSPLPPATFALPPGGFSRSANAAKSGDRRGAWRLVRIANAPELADGDDAGEAA